LNRPASPLLHDYKPAGGPPKKARKRLAWFAAGLALPLALILLLRATNTETPSVPAGADIDTVVATVPDTSGEDEGTAIDVTRAPMSEAKPAPVDTASPTVAEKVFTDVPSILIDEFAAPEPEFERLTLRIGRGDTLDALFRRHGLSIGHLIQMSNLDEAGRYFRTLKPGDTLEIEHDGNQVHSLYSKLDLTSGLRVTRTDDGFVEELVDHPVERRTRLAYGMIDNSLYVSGSEAGLSDKITMSLASIFGWDIDFVYDIRVGDNFYVQYEEIWQDGEYVMDGEVLAAEFNNRQDTYRAVRFVDRDGRVGYFTPDGRSVRKAFTRTPVDARVSSPFNPNRLHPVLKVRRPHKGVDYGAPSGTPIKVTGDGKVVFKGVKGGYGNTVIVQHGGNITTLYAHMSRFAKGIRVGSRVRQNQTIGYVGATGLVTAAHLHYEFRLNGVHRNPRTVPLPQAEPIDASQKPQFMAASQPILQRLDDYKNTRLASVAVSAN
jgi:murein DD-endopeptidase MepM/ murein hydrolase activator NlpD